jgi:hypothetical protein
MNWALIVIRVTLDHVTSTDKTPPSPTTVIPTKVGIQFIRLDRIRA